MEVYEFDDIIVVIYQEINYSYSLINILNYIQKYNSINNSKVVYLYGDENLEKISNQYLNVIYINDKKEIIQNYNLLKRLVKLDKKLNQLFSFEQYELSNISVHIIYEICSILEYANKNHLNVNKIREKVIKYLETQNKSEIISKVKKIRIYDNN